jgi:plastocyanin
MTPSGANVTDNGRFCAARHHPMPRVGWQRVAFAPAVLALLAGCSSGSSGSSAKATTSGVQSVTIGATDDFRFTPADVTVHPGKVRISLVDKGSYPHNISFPSLAATSASVSGSPGQTSTTLVLTLTKPGRYGFVCTYHSSAGMKGSLVVLKGP